MQTSRRQFVKIGALAAGAVLLRRLAADDAATDKLKAIHDQLVTHMTDLVTQAKARLENGPTLLMPCVSNTYRGVWPDDTLYPLMAVPSLAKKDELSGVLSFLTDSMADLHYVPDRVEADGLPILSPGGSASPPMTDRMPLHLPAAWIRLLDYYRGFGAEIPRKQEWAKLIKRSIERVPFACGLAYADPQKPPIGFGFHDSIKISGFELMSSLMLYRGLQRAVKLFEGSIEQTTLDHWTHLADGIRSNLHRSYDARIGGYVGGSRQGHQFSVWANGLIYSLADAPAKQKIVQFYRDNRQKIFKLGCTRQIAEPSWQGTGGAGSYQNGGFWATGTGYVLPAIHDQDPGFALELAGELVENLPKINFAEWIDANSKPAGAMKFLASVALPILGMRSIMERKPLIEYF
ncbi:MAG TPA: hypothetical protein VGP72_27535 [Planctomycetota bacterium]|jgi:hypothetical protein